MPTDDLDFGPCCACGQSGPTVRNMLMLPLRAATPGFGCWGCVVCGVPAAGAVAVLCDACLAAKAEIRFACDGALARHGRVPLAQLTEPFDHDRTKHQGEMAWMN